MADHDKTEQATAQRKKKAREQGNVVRSRELSAVLAAAGTVGALMLVGHNMGPHWAGLYRKLLESAVSEGVESNGPVLFWCAAEVLRWTAPVLLAALACSVSAGLAQGGLTIAPAALAIKPERLNPATKLGQIFSLSGMTNMLKSLLPFGAIAWVGINAVSARWLAIVHASSANLGTLSGMLGSTALEIGWKSGLVLLVWSGVDYGMTWHKSNSDLKMSKQELKEEHKQTEGNPAIKTAIRRMRRRMRRRFSKKAVKTATVIVTNPTHYAVALRYDTSMPAPMVVEKGLDLIALEIREIATEAGIPLMENRPLAQALYKSVEVGDAIPAALYQAVADILIVVFRAQAELRAQEERRRNRNASGELIQR